MQVGEFQGAGTRPGRTTLPQALWKAAQMARGVAKWAPSGSKGALLASYAAQRAIQAKRRNGSSSVYKIPRHVNPYRPTYRTRYGSGYSRVRSARRSKFGRSNFKKRVSFMRRRNRF